MNARAFTQPKLSVQGATKVYQHPVGRPAGASTAAASTSMDGEIVSIVGPSGCGKTTLLWSMSGLHGLTSRRGAARRQAGHRPASRNRHGVPGGEPPALAQSRRQHPLSLRDQGHEAGSRLDRRSASTASGSKASAGGFRASCRAACSSAPRWCGRCRSSPRCC